MSEFSVSYAGIEDAVTRLASISRGIASVSSDVYQASSGVNGIESLANKGYAEKIGACAKNADRSADQIYRRAYTLSEIGQLYSKSEQQALDALADRVTAENGFSAQSSIVAASAASLHASPSFGEALGTTIGDRAHDALNTLNDWSSWLEAKKDEFIPEGTAGRRAYDIKMGKWEKTRRGIEGFIHFALNPTNPYAVKEGTEATADLLGLGDVYDLFERQIERQDAINARLESDLEGGHTGRAIAHYLASETLYAVQAAGDAVWTGIEVVGNAATGGKAGAVFGAIESGFSRVDEGLRKLVDRI